MRLRKGTIPFCASMPPNINIQVLFCVTALQDIMQLHLRTGRVVRLFLTSQRFSSDHYKTWATKQSSQAHFIWWLIIISIFMISTGILKHAALLLISISQVETLKPLRVWMKITKWLRAPSTDRKQGLSFILDSIISRGSDNHTPI